MTTPEDDLTDDKLPPPIEAAPANPPKKMGRPRKVRVIDQNQAQMSAPIGQPRRVKLKPAEDRPPEGSLLSEDEVKKIKAEAKAEALEELRAGERKKTKAKALQEERQRLSPQADEEIIGFVLEMPSYAQHWPMVIDGIWYYHGKYYEVPLSKYEVFAEQMYRAYEHQRVIDGKSIAEDSRRQYREVHSGATLSGKAVSA